MSTQKQIDANRQNAQKSTGPKTPEGKSAVAQNGIKHGLLARQSTIPGESQAEFDLYHQQVFAQYDPSGPIETVLTERIVTLSWRLRRINRLQTAAVNSFCTSQKSSPLSGLTARFSPKPPDDSTPLPDLDIGKITVKDFANSRVIDRLSMLERRMENSLYRTIMELQRLQMIRKMDM